MPEPTKPLAARARGMARRLLEEQREQRRARRVARIAATLPRPAVTTERTHVGPRMDALVDRAKANQLPVGADPDYDLVRQNFDHLHFLLQATPLHERPEVDPIEYFLSHGPRAVNSPHRDFSMATYLRRHPERASGERSPYLAWLKHGRAAGEIADPAEGITEMASVLGLREDELVAESVRLRADAMTRLRTGTLGEMFAKAVELEPLIGEAWRETPRMKQLPLRNDAVARGAAAIHACHDEAGLRRARIVIVADGPGGGGDGFDVALARALAESMPADEIVVIHTDWAGPQPANRFPDGVRILDLGSRINTLRAHHAREQAVREQTLVALVRSFCAEAVINVDSRLFYAALAPYGKALAHSDRVFLAFFGVDRGPLGVGDAWSLRWLYPTAEYVAGYLTDSDRVRDGLVEHFCLGPTDVDRIHVLRTPVRPEIPRAARPQPAAGRRPVVCWQPPRGREQGFDVAIEVARRMPEVTFRLHRVAAVAAEEAQPDVPANVALVDTPVDIEGGGLDGVDAWLHTATRDAVPGLLLAVAMAQVPIVAVDLPATADVLTPQDAWLVSGSEPDDADAYVTVLRQLLGELRADPEAVTERARTLRERLIAERPSIASYVASLLLRPGRSHDDSGHTGTLADQKEAQ